MPTGAISKVTRADWTIATASGIIVTGGKPPA
jgi:hypothetical protein